MARGGKQVARHAPAECLHSICFACVIETANWPENYAASKYAAAKIDFPGNRAAAPNSSSMRSNWLYFAMRSVREAEPVLICPASSPPPDPR